MHNTINVVMARVFNTVPPQILRLDLQLANRYGACIPNVPTFIMQKIIRERVTIDCNISGGKLKEIILRPEYREKSVREMSPYDSMDGGYSIYRIPPEARDNVSISQVLRVNYPYSTLEGIPTGYTQSGGASIASAATNMLNSFTMQNTNNPPSAILMAGDIIRIVPQQGTQQDLVATVRLSYDEFFESLHVSAVHTLAKLVEQATKAWTYNQLFIDIDRASIEFGMDIGAVRTIVEECRDANQMYDELLQKWAAAAALDPKFYAQISYLMV